MACHVYIEAPYQNGLKSNFSLESPKVKLLKILKIMKKHLVFQNVQTKSKFGGFSKFQNLSKRSHIWLQNEPCLRKMLCNLEILDGGQKNTLFLKDPVPPVN